MLSEVFKYLVIAGDSCLQVRGRLVLLYELLLCGGMLSSLLADVALMHLPDNWRWMVGLPVVPAAVLAGNLLLFGAHVCQKCHFYTAEAETSTLRTRLDLS